MRTGKNNAGFTYMGMLVIILIIGISSAALGRSWKLFTREEKEKELLWRGNQFRLAIERYYNDPRHKGKYPTSLQDLLQDPAYLNPVRDLRKLYKDPMTGKADWALDPPPALGGGTIAGGTLVAGQAIGGVHSISDRRPLKKDNFDLADISFRNKTKYSEWMFDYNPNAAQGQVQIIPGGMAVPATGQTPAMQTPASTGNPFGGQNF